MRRTAMIDSPFSIKERIQYLDFSCCRPVKSSHSSKSHHLRRKLSPKLPSSWRIIGLISGLAFLFVVAGVRPAWASNATATATNTEAAKLKIQSLIASAAMITTMGGFGLFHMGLGRLAKDLLVAAGRCSLQVYLLGSVVLQRLMGTTHPFVIGAWIVGVGLVAGNEAFSRVQYTYPNMHWHVLGIIPSTFCLWRYSTMVSTSNNHPNCWNAIRQYTI